MVTGPLPVTILPKTKDIADMGKDANLEDCYYNLPINLSCYTIVIDGELY